MATYLGLLPDIVSAEEDVDAVETVDTMSGGQDPLIVEEGAATEVSVGSLVHEDAGHPGVLVRWGLTASSNARSGTGNTTFVYKTVFEVLKGMSVNNVMIGDGCYVFSASKSNIQRPQLISYQ